MRAIPLCSKCSLNWEDAAVIFHLAVLLLEIFLGCTNENMREAEDDADALKAEQCHITASKSVPAWPVYPK